MSGEGGLRSRLEQLVADDDGEPGAVLAAVRALHADVAASRTEAADRWDAVRTGLRRVEERQDALGAQLLVLTGRVDGASARADAAADELRAALALLREELPQLLGTAVGSVQRDLERVGAAVRRDVGRVADGLGAVQDAVRPRDEEALGPALQDQLDALGEALRGELVLLGVELRRTADGLEDLREDLEGGSARADEADDALLRHLREQEEVLRAVLGAGRDAAPRLGEGPHHLAEQ